MGISDRIKDMLGGNDDEARAQQQAEDAAGTAQGKAAGAGGALGEHAKGVVTAAGDRIDGMTGGKAASHVDKAQDKANEVIDRHAGGA